MAGAHQEFPQSLFCGASSVIVDTSLCCGDGRPPGWGAAPVVVWLSRTLLGPGDREPRQPAPEAMARARAAAPAVSHTKRSRLDGKKNAVNATARKGLCQSLNAAVASISIATPRGREATPTAARAG